ncbi:ACT domain-containing protein ACR4 [Sesamum angolense]|uniref:ACT domain-containing protein ACR n=1 Tax=Sesamum angolense TaxID=2727404 RepID=A0AAE2C6F6_9LAMI|nr:ACT domain-containing protein ACR4 [Sesamum angolense]
MDDEYEKLIRRMNPPRVVIDNESCKNATVIQVDSANKQGILLEVVQVLTDLNLMITKAYICSDGGWFMDVFNVTDHDGNKITDEGILDYIQKSLGPDSCFASSMRRSVGVTSGMDHTSIELIGSDRPGLLSEVSAVLTHLKCNVVNAEVWTHNTRAAAVMQVTDEETGGAINDPERLAMVKRLLCNVLKGSNKSREAKTVVSLGATHTERRLHQMMFDARDYERMCDDSADEKERPNVNVVNWHDKDYSWSQSEAYQEYCIRHIDGSPVKSDAERQRVIQCLEAAIQRRVSEGLKLELCTSDRVGLLSDVTRIFRENSLTVTRAEVTTRAGKAVNTFYVRDASGYPVDPKIIDSIRQTIGQTILRVKGSPEESNQVPQESPTRFLFGGLFKSRSFCNFGLVRGGYYRNCLSLELVKGCLLIDADNVLYRVSDLFQNRLTNAMESLDSEFPGFQTLVPRDEFVVTQKPLLSRLQRRAPHPLQLKPPSSECRSVVKSIGSTKDSSSSAAGAVSIVNSYFSSKDPIPLLSPLVLPSMLEIQQETMTKSH